MLGLAALVGFLSLWKANRSGIARSPSEFSLLCNLLILGAAAGGFSYSVLMRAAGLAAAEGSFLHSGLPTFGVMAGVAGAALLDAPLQKLPRAVVLDAVFACVPLCHGIAKLGCFLAGCCYGIPAGSGIFWAVRFHGTPEVPRRLWGVPLHPTQLYEAAGDALIAWLLASSLMRRKTPGTVCAVALGGYGLLRFIVGFVRADEPTLGFAHLQASQGVAGMVALGALGWLWLPCRPLPESPAGFSRRR